MTNVFTETPAALRVGAVFGVPEAFDASVGELAGMVGLPEASELVEAAREAMAKSEAERRAVFARLSSSVPVEALQSLPEQSAATVLSASLTASHHQLCDTVRRHERDSLLQRASRLCAALGALD